MMPSTEVKKTLVQCDFDGTVTEKDVSFLLLDAFADGDWRQLLAQYQTGKISVNSFNSRAFAMVKADRQTLLEFAQGKVKIRAGFHKLVTYCRQKGFKFVIVSNGMDFYIKALLQDIGIKDTEVFAARAKFSPEGIKTRYIGPDGSQLEDSFKEAYTRSFLDKGYRVVYIGNGISDISPAKQAHHIFATDALLAHCKKIRLNCIPFNDLDDVVRSLELLPPG
jgi:2-hydroxy-3-keto-5-methylthiopentenyl-1-phosphate phosphatase